MTELLDSTQERTNCRKVVDKAFVCAPQRPSIGKRWWLKHPFVHHNDRPLQKLVAEASVCAPQRPSIAERWWLKHPFVHHNDCLVQANNDDDDDDDDDGDDCKKLNPHYITMKSKPDDSIRVQKHFVTNNDVIRHQP